MQRLWRRIREVEEINWTWTAFALTLAATLIYGYHLDHPAISRVSSKTAYATKPASTYTPPTPHIVTTSDINLSKLDILVNDFRNQGQLGTLHDWSPLVYAAQTKCNDLVAKDYWGHTSPSGVTLTDLINRYVPYWTTAGENIASGYDSAEDVFKAWVKSPEHLANLTNTTYTDVGYAVCKSKNFAAVGGGPQIIVVQEFVGR